MIKKMFLTFGDKRLFQNLTIMTTINVVKHIADSFLTNVRLKREFRGFRGGVPRTILILN